MGIFRSEAMRHGTIVLPADRARDLIDMLGKDTKIEFEDMNGRDMHRPYRKYIQRIDEMERSLRFILDEIERHPTAPALVKGNVAGFLDNSHEYKLDEVEARLKRAHRDFAQFKENNSKLVVKRNEALEELYVVEEAKAQQLRPTGRAYGRATSSASSTTSSGEHQPLRDAADELEDPSDSSSSASRRLADTVFSNVAGVIPQDEKDRFARVLFRATRGNTFVHFQQFPNKMTDPKTGKAVDKSVFVVYFQDSRIGPTRSAMGERVNKICNTFGVNVYRWPSTENDAKVRTETLRNAEDEANTRQKHYDEIILDSVSEMLRPAGSPDAPVDPRRNSLIEEWRLFCLKERSIYATLNLFESRRDHLSASCWFPADEEYKIFSLFSQRGEQQAMLMPDKVKPRKMPPTYIKRNDFSAATQMLVDLYGLPSYQEANPTLFSLATFPFLFGVMYGDVGHGLLLFVFGLLLVWKAEDFKSISLLYNARYMIAMMGFFGVYCGLLYNDFFSVGIDLFGSRYVLNEAEAEEGKHHFKPGFDALNTGETGPLGYAGPYPFGLDPIWHGASNELIFANSLKMKLSVILGVTQMIVGLLLRFSNCFYRMNMVDLFCECVPMMVFMICFFGFMDYMILYKWVTHLPNPPSIINSLIAMGMGQTDPSPMFGDKLPSLLMLLTMSTVPWMLFPKPFILYLRMKSHSQGARGPGGAGAAGHGIGEAEALTDEGEHKDDEEEEEEHGFGEVVIHQVIETIEYVLGTVSHTASYLRLWALSLAHQQLSFVFFQKTLLMGMSMGFPLNIIALYVMFAMWFAITLGVLMGMDVMECVLHVLRLHWIEFNSKFYKGEGHAFVPFCHEDTCTEDDG